MSNIVIKCPNHPQKVIGIWGCEDADNVGERDNGVCNNLMTFDFEAKITPPRVVFSMQPGAAL
jgi:hypothetical protein